VCGGEAVVVIADEAAVGAVLRIVVDASGLGHFAYATARRTICLDHRTDECELAVSELPTSECSVCEQTRRKLQRRRRDWWGSDPLARQLPTRAPAANGQRTG
jgi:hypothetical protein